MRLLLVLQVAPGPLPQLHAIWGETDNAFFDAWGRRIAAGDLLQREPWHPMAAWMRQVARAALARQPSLAAELGIAKAGAGDQAVLEQLAWDRWLGGPTFFQEPGYPYLVGLTYRVFGPDPWPVFAWQLLLGVAGVLVIHRLGRRLFSHVEGALAGLLAVLAPIPLFYEVTLLRDALVVFLTMALALLMAWTVDGPRRRWFVLGLAFGAAALVKQTFLAFPLLMAVWRLAAVRSPARDRLAAAGLVLAGLSLALLPVALRNVTVGVPVLAMNGSALSQLPLFHTAGATPFAVDVDMDYVRVLLAAKGSAVRGLLEAARTHQSAWGLMALEAKKAAYAWHGYESPNNVDFYLFRLAAPVLSALPIRVVVLVPLAAIGLARDAGRAWPLLVAIAASLGSVVLGTALARYRAPLLALLMPLAGAGILTLYRWLAARRWVPIIAAMLASVPYLVWAAGDPPGLGAADRAAAYRRDAEAFAPRSPALASLQLLEALRLEPGAKGVEERLGQFLLEANDPEAALQHLDAAVRSSERPAARVLRARALAEVGRTIEALAEVRAALAAEPAVAGGRALRDFLEGQARQAKGATPGGAVP